MMGKIKKYLLITCASGTLALGTACSPVLDTRGALLQPHDLEKLHVGVSTKQDVIAALGSPSTISSFYDNTWYYIGQQTETIAFYEPETIRQQVIEIKFSPEDQVMLAMSEVAPDQAQEIDPVARVTPTAGKELTVIQQIVGNVGKYSNKDAKRPGK